MVFNWQTSVVGIISFVLGGCVWMDWISSQNAIVLYGLITGALGLAAKDRNVTGGTREQ